MLRNLRMMKLGIPEHLRPGGERPTAGERTTDREAEISRAEREIERQLIAIEALGLQADVEERSGLHGRSTGDYRAD